MTTKQQTKAANYTKVMAFILFAALQFAGAGVTTTATAQSVQSDDEAARAKIVRPNVGDSLAKTLAIPFASVEDQTSNSLIGGLFGARNGDKFETPVTETGVVRKATGVEDLHDWFSMFFSQEKVGTPVEAIAGGFPALVFDAEIGGEKRRGIVVDYGDFVMYYFTTDKAASSEDLEKMAFSRMEMVARAATDLDPNNPDRCNCVLYVRNNFVPSLPRPLTTSTQKQNVINHYFPRVPSAPIHPIYSGTYSANWHVSAVRNIEIQRDGSLRLTIREANYPTCGIYERSGTPEQLGIIGYYDPTYPATSGSRSDTNAPKLNSITNSTVPRGREFEIVANGANFEASKAQIVIFGGWCDAWGKCVIPNSNLRQPTSTKLRIPVLMNNPGTYHVYVFNPTTGKTSNGKPITVS